MNHDETTVHTVKDSNGNILSTGDSVHLTQDLKVKGSSISLKRGEVIKNIKIVPDEEEGVECRIGKAVIMLNPKFLKKK